MPLLFLIIFIAVPIAEIAVLIEVGGAIGLAPTIALVILTAVIGTFMLRMQGLSVLNRATQALNEGRAPVDSVIDGVCLIIAGAFLLTPGFITDSAGFALLVPGIRSWLARAVFNRIKASKNIHVDIFGEDPGGQPPFADDGPDNFRPGPVIEGEIIDDDAGQADNGDRDASVRGKRSEKSPWRRGS